MNGWRYEWIATLPRDVYDVLIEEMEQAHAEAEAARQARG